MAEAMYTECNDRLVRYEKGWWVLVEAGNTVRVGIVSSRILRRYFIQFGACGPYEWVGWENLSLATKSQVHYMEGGE